MDKSDDLFSMDDKSIKSLPTMTQTKKLCRCDANAGVNSLTEEALCSEISPIQCEKVLPVQQDICFEKEARRRRSPFSHIPDNIVQVDEKKVFKVNLAFISLPTLKHQIRLFYLHVLTCMLFYSYIYTPH